MSKTYGKRKKPKYGQPRNYPVIAFRHQLYAPSPNMQPLGTPFIALDIEGDWLKGVVSAYVKWYGKLKLQRPSWYVVTLDDGRILEVNPESLASDEVYWREWASKNKIVIKE